MPWWGAGVETLSEQARWGLTIVFLAVILLASYLTRPKPRK